MVNQSYFADHTKGFEIYLHEEGEFWPGMEMENIGQTKSIYVPIKKEVRGTFKVVQKINLDKESDHCVEDIGYSYTARVLLGLDLEKNTVAYKLSLYSICNVYLGFYGVRSCYFN